MKGLSGMQRSIDMDKHMKTREQIGKITQQQDKLHRGRAVADAMLEAENLAHSYNHAPQWQQDLTRDQVNKRRHALKELVRTNRDPRQEVDSFFPGNINRPVPPEQLAGARTFRGRDPTGFAPDRRAAPQLHGMATPRQRSAPASRGTPPPTTRRAAASARGAASSASTGRFRRRLAARLTGGTAD